MNKLSKAEKKKTLLQVEKDQAQFMGDSKTD